MTTLIKALYERLDIEGTTGLSWDQFIANVENPNGYTSAKIFYTQLCNRIVEDWNKHV